MRRRSWCLPNPPSRLRGDITRSWRTDARFFSPIERKEERKSVTRTVASEEEGSTVATTRTSRGERLPENKADLIAALFLRATTPAMAAA